LECYLYTFIINAFFSKFISLGNRVFLANLDLLLLIQYDELSSVRSQMKKKMYQMLNLFVSDSKNSLDYIYSKLFPFFLTFKIYLKCS